MASLDPGTYRLRNGTNHTGTVSSKRLILVKLTDSALKAIEDLNQKKVSCIKLLALKTLTRDALGTVDSGSPVN